ncbi:hypothetical protein FGU65_13715 [Methanoculleus sp. FWC-SCC1]|uniref:Uncharacterized protein n=1 Tax=Methanoculleus frigidifontis TaxID=2584085 RepID=A0ABT8MDA8_9EURY|nr:hypothetical protein [Methanoculleus sp. FWC-SCC1]MDN7025927.1 hypothetical protein [Methanoculleus sp. FWC-SCC1]
MPAGAEGGITEIAYGYTEPKVALDDARAMLEVWLDEQQINASDIRIYRVEGISVDPGGMARSWVFGTCRAGEPLWLMYDRQDVAVLSLNSSLPADEIVFESIVPPEDLYDRNRAEIRDVLERHGTDVTDLALAGGRYVLTVRSGAGIETVRFRAETGEVVSSQ